MRVLVLGGYGLIGSAIVAALRRAGHEVTGLGRSARKGRAFLADMPWIGADIAAMQTPEDWLPVVEGFDAVVNASGLLQNGLRDNVAAVQEGAIVALVGACERAGVDRFVQISAPGVTDDASTEFYRTKAAADLALTESRLRSTIFRPGLVLSHRAYGGTSLLRALAAFPLVQPLVLAEADMQTVHIDDVADAVVHALEHDLESGDFDLVADERLSLADVVAGFRSWLGFSPAAMVVRLPRWMGRSVARLADLAGWLGWRPPLRTTALRVLESGIRGDGTSWASTSGRRLSTCAESLERIPATVQERIYARATLVFPLLVVVLGLFWIVSGLIGLLSFTEARALVAGKLPGWAAPSAVLAGSLVDIAIGIAILIRPLTRIASLASIAVAAVYLAGGLLVTPALWLDPLGPMIKVFPAIALALAVASLVEDR